jgi:hypothetical protein
MTSHSLLILVFITFALFTSCNRDKGTPCTEEYRYVTITVNGALLDDFFTIRNSNGDTIRHDEDPFAGISDNVYIVLSDGYQNVIRNKVENFTFSGYLNDSLVVNELFVIKADECHIEYVSGKTEVSL